MTHRPTADAAGASGTAAGSGATFTGAGGAQSRRLSSNFNFKPAALENLGRRLAQAIGNSGTSSSTATAMGGAAEAGGSIIPPGASMQLAVTSAECRAPPEQLIMPV